MRTLHLLRHAESSGAEPGLDDASRSLGPRGVEQMPSVAAHLRRAGIAPDLVLCSPARRARQTLDLLGEAIGGEVEVRVEDWLYGRPAEAVLDRLRALPDTARSVLVVGHNPTLQALGLLLAGSGEQLEQLAATLPTAGLATLEAPIDAWAELAPGSAHLSALVRSEDRFGA